jgi:hypothetical protein
LLFSYLTIVACYNDKLHGLNERRPLDEDGNPIPSDSSKSETKESEKEEEDENGDQFKKCSVCKKEEEDENGDLRIKSSHKSRKEEQARKKLRVTSNEFEEQPTSNDGIVESIQAIQSGIISVASSSESLYSDHLGSSSVSLSSHITQSLVQSPVHNITMISTFDPPTLSSIFSSSTSSSLSTSLVTSNNVTYPSATVVSTVAPDRIWKRKNVPWSKEEKVFITNFGLSCLNKATKKKQKVWGTDLFNAYKKEEQFAGYLREGDHMKEYWKGWISLNKKKI